MRMLYHWTLDPASRAIRLALAEKGMAFTEVVAPPGEHHAEVQKLLPGAGGPTLHDRAASLPVIAVGTHAVLEFLEEADTRIRLLPTSAAERAEARRIWHWTESEFEAAVTSTLLNERLLQWTRRDHVPDSDALRRGSHALRGRLTYLNALAEARPFLAGRSLTVADFIAAAHLSSLDYFGDVAWSSVPDLAQWYIRLKSRPAFRAILADRVPGTRPSAHYAQLDF